MITLLHLSDLHFAMKGAGTQFDRDEEIRRKLLADLGKDGRTGFNAILITGDIAYNGLADEFKRASDWFDELRDLTHVDVDSLFVIPGNHDVNRDYVGKNGILYSAHEKLRGLSDTEQRNRALEAMLSDKGLDLLRPLHDYGVFASRHDCQSTAKELAWMRLLKTPLDDGSILRLHGLNSAYLSDEGDIKANLLVSPFQFNHLSKDDVSCIDVVLCHHPPNWLLDDNEAGDHFRRHAHLILTGHEHACRCYDEGKRLRVCAGAVHPSRGETPWQPGYNVIRISVEPSPKRTLLIQVESRVWNRTDFVAYQHPEQGSFYMHRFELPEWHGTNPPPQQTSASKAAPTGVAQESLVNPLKPAAVDFAVARRTLIVHFFQLNSVSRFQAAVGAGVWDESDDPFDGPERWARVIARAEESGQLPVLWNTVAAVDDSMRGQPNPFIH